VSAQARGSRPLKLYETEQPKCWSVLGDGPTSDGNSPKDVCWIRGQCFWTAKTRTGLQK